MVTQSDMEGGGVYPKVTSPLNVQKLNEFFPQESVASPKFVSKTKMSKSQARSVEIPTYMM